MNAKKTAEEAMIAKYLANAAARRKRTSGKVMAMAPLAVQPENGVITVRFGADAKPLSALGGIAKVVGPSRIDIPEFKRRRG